MLDVGTGSGILAILGCRMGLGQVDAFDIDPESIERARINMQLNCCRFNLRLADIAGFSPHDCYDIITANLLHNIIRDNLSALRAMLNPGGTMLLSGVIDLWDAEIRELLKSQGLRLARHLNKEGWNAYQVESPCGMDAGR